MALYQAVVNKKSITELRRSGQYSRRSGQNSRPSSEDGGLQQSFNKILSFAPSAIKSKFSSDAGSSHVSENGPRDSVEELSIPDSEFSFDLDPDYIDGEDEPSKSANVAVDGSIEARETPAEETSNS